MAVFQRKPTPATMPDQPKPEESTAKPNSGKRTMKLADEMALLDNIISGKALPAHMAQKGANSNNAEVKQRYRDEVAADYAAKLALSPLIAVCFNHRCKCGNSWQDFGFFARAVKEQMIPGAGAVSRTTRIDYDPTPERPSATEWQDRDEAYCLKCVGVEVVPGSAIPSSTITDRARLEQLRHVAREEVAAIREDAVNLRSQAYTEMALRRVSRVIIEELPYGIEADHAIQRTSLLLGVNAPDAQ